MRVSHFLGATWSLGFASEMYKRNIFNEKYKLKQSVNHFRGRIAVADTKGVDSVKLPLLIIVTFL